MHATLGPPAPVRRARLERLADLGRSARLSCVPLASRAQDDKGQVVKKHVPHLHQWNRSYTIEKLLINIRGLFGKPEFRKLTNQPPEGETF